MNFPFEFLNWLTSHNLLRNKQQKKHSVGGNRYRKLKESENFLKGEFLSFLFNAFLGY